MFNIEWNKSFSTGKSENSLSSSFEFEKLIFAPCLSFRVMIFQVANGSNAITSFFDVTFISLVDVIVERIFERQSKGLVSTLNSDGNSTNNGFVWSPGVGDKSGSVEESWSDDVGFEIFLDSALFHVPSNNFDGGIRIVSDLDLVETKVSPVVALFDVSWIEVIVGVVVFTKIVGWVNVSRSH